MTTHGGARGPVYPSNRPEAAAPPPIRKTSTGLSEQRPQHERRQATK
jgi:hypothetical protein